MEDLGNQSQETNTQETNTQETNTETQNTASTTETTQSTEQSTEQTQNTEQTQVQTIKVKFNHEEKEIPYEEATKLIQKGMNYDKVDERYNELASNPGLQYLNKIAEANGVTVEAIVEYWQEEEKQAQINELAQKNIPEAEAREILEARQANAIKKQKDAQQVALNKMFLDLIKSYPEAKPEDITQEIWNDVAQNGRTLVNAYSRHENAKLKEENAKLEEKLQIRDKNNQNAETSPGSVTGQGNIPTGYFSQDQVKKMTEEEVSKHYDSIWESMKKWK